MTSADPPPADGRRGRTFRYEGYEIDPAAGRLTCRYSLDGRDFAEVVTFPNPLQGRDATNTVYLGTKPAR